MPGGSATSSHACGGQCHAPRPTVQFSNMRPIGTQCPCRSLAETGHPVTLAGWGTGRHHATSTGLTGRTCTNRRVIACHGSAGHTGPHRATLPRNTVRRAGSVQVSATNWHPAARGTRRRHGASTGRTRAYCQHRAHGATRCQHGAHGAAHGAARQHGHRAAHGASRRHTGQRRHGHRIGPRNKRRNNGEFGVLRITRKAIAIRN